MNTVLYWAASFALVCFALGMVLAAVRLLRGPTAQDRVLALDTLYINGMLTMLVFGIRSGVGVFRHRAADRAVRLRGLHGHGPLPAARGGDRAMIESQIPLWAGIPASILLVLGGLLALTGSAGLLRFRSFYARIHAPTLGNTLGCGCVLASSMLVFSALSSRPVFHEVIITLLLIVSSPVTAMLLMRAATYRGSLKREDADRDAR